MQLQRCVQCRISQSLFHSYQFLLRIPCGYLGMSTALTSMSASHTYEN